MNESLDTQRCYAYLLGEMGAKDRDLFESRLSSDRALRGELRGCECDLAEFADASLPDLQPSERVWSDLARRIRGQDELSLESPKNSERHSRFAFRSYVWAAAACLLLSLNLWQWMVLREKDVEYRDRANAYKVEMLEVATFESLDSLQKELAALQKIVAARDIDHSRAPDGESISKPQFGEDRVYLLNRIEYLEKHYMALMEIAMPYIGGAKVSEFSTSVVELHGDESRASSGIWDTVSTLLKEPGVVAIAASGGWLRASGAYSTRTGLDGEARADGVLRFATSESPQEANDPYAFAFLNPASGQAVLSLGNLPLLSGEEQMVLWGREPEQEGYTQIGSLPAVLNGSSGDVAIQYPNGFERGIEFVVSIEPVDAPEGGQPGDRRILQTDAKK